MTTDAIQTEAKPITKRWHFVMCVCNNHAACPGFVDKETEQYQCSCECHTNPDFVHTCSRCGEAVTFVKTEHGSLAPFNADGTRHPWTMECTRAMRKAS